MKPGAGRFGRRGRWAWRGLLVGLTFLGLAQIASGVYIHAKARFAEQLLERAWGQTPDDGAADKAWSWADIWPVARLLFPKYGVDLVVLEGTGDEAPAFGPGRMLAFASLGGPGTAVIAAHGDSDFRFLEKVRSGDEFWIETANGRRHRYAVIDIATLDARNTSSRDEPGPSPLVLVTCYPVDVLSVGGALRYLVFAGGSGTA